MEDEYFVMYQRDITRELRGMADDRMHYNDHKGFADKEEATEFALSHLQDIPIVAKTVKALADYDAEADYVVVAHFECKHQQRHFDMGHYFVPTNEVVRCSQEDLDATVRELANENPNKMYLGIEEKLVPSALDIIRSVNNTKTLC